MASSIIKKIFRKEEVIDAASHPHLHDNAVVIRSGNAVSVVLKGFKDIPTGVSTTICTLPSDYRPMSTDRIFDIIVPSTAGNPGMFRVNIRTSGNVDVYVYYPQNSDLIAANARSTLTFAV